MTQRNKIIIFIVFIIVVLLIPIFHYLNSRFYIFADIIGPKYTLFSKSPLEPVYTNTIPKKSEIIKNNGKVSSFTARGETEPITFSVRPYINLGLVQINLSDLVSGKNKILKENIDLRNIKTWEQCGPRPGANADWIKSCNNPDVTMAYNIPELLVKDNEQDLQAEEKGWVQADKKYHAPVVNEKFRADLKKGITHTFYLSIKTPKSTPAGNYTGTVTFKPQNAPGQRFSLKLKVLPFELPESEKEIILHLTQRLADRADFGFADIGKEKYEQYLDMVREAGVTSVVLLFDPRKPVKGEIDNSVENLTWLVGKIKEKGFHGTLIWRGSINSKSDQIRRNLAILKNQGFNVYVYGKDEPNDATKMKQGLAISKQIHSAGGKVTTSIKKQCSDVLLDPASSIYNLAGVRPIEKMDLPIYQITSTSTSSCSFRNATSGSGTQTVAEYITGLQNGSIKKNSNKEFYYFQIWPEQMGQVYWTKPSYVRTMAGFFLYKSGLDGIVPYGLDSVYRTHGNKEYDDFDAALKDFRAVYRTQQGFLKTLQFETFREGIDDMRYLTKFDNVLAQLRLIKPVTATKIKLAVDKKLKIYTYKGAGKQDPRIASNNVNQVNRKFIADKIVEIQNLLTVKESIIKKKQPQQNKINPTLK